MNITTSGILLRFDKFGRAILALEPREETRHLVRVFVISLLTKVSISHRNMFSSAYEQCDARCDWAGQRNWSKYETAQVLECVELCTIPIRASQRVGEESKQT